MWLFNTARAEWTGEIVNLAVERFERRLVEEISGLRVEMARGHATLREELAREVGTLREAVAQQGASLRQALAEQGASLREALAQQGAALRVEIATNRFELLKWSFLFWVGQVLAIGGVMAAMLRVFGRTS